MKKAQLTALGGNSAVPREWRDGVTGRRIIRLSELAGTSSLYFHQNAFSRDGRLMVVTTPQGIAAIDMRTRRNTLILPSPTAEVLMVGRRTSRLWYIDEVDGQRTVFSLHLLTGETARHYRLTPGETVSALNADETLLLGSETGQEKAFNDIFTAAVSDAAGGHANPQGEWMVATEMYHPHTGRPLTFAEQKEVHINQRLERRLPMTLFVVDVASGTRRDVHQATDWLNHLQFSPTDPRQILFCHEGPWHKVDRIWAIRSDGSALSKIHARAMNMEIAGHEFFSPDGNTIWYDLQTPRGEVFWLAGYELHSGRRRRYALERDSWSVHFTLSPDGQYFAGDGGDKEMVAHAPDGKWISLLVPESIPDVAGISAANADSLIDPGVLRCRRLVDMSAHDYRLEPNLAFTPDGDYLVFRSNMHGEVHTYAVALNETDAAGNNP
ncbi:oligogalacturonate lyase family protein [Brenneria tiliae]|uniref:Oligogalacturonate lyase family protein n=1 Tax=Brenneria tiliae TaxID=2914984 RepID=A0ABT0MU81_9GAMM|nr:oligogalacturonate lyase family protein [Brenneria tiliae]MCL2893162.1 oligogalacturonate lyase family protein [Brenneria tiliae]